MRTAEWTDANSKELRRLETFFVRQAYVPQDRVELAKLHARLTELRKRKQAALEKPE